MDCTTAKCYSRDRDLYACPEGHIPYAQTPHPPLISGREQLPTLYKSGTSVNVRVHLTVLYSSGTRRCFGDEINSEPLSLIQDGSTPAAVCDFTGSDKPTKETLTGGDFVELGTHALVLGDGLAEVEGAKVVLAHAAVNGAHVVVVHDRQVLARLGWRTRVRGAGVQHFDRLPVVTPQVLKVRLQVDGWSSLQRRRLKEDNVGHMISHFEGK